MTKKEIVLWLVFADFALFTGYTFYTEGVLGFFPTTLAFATGSAWGLQVIIDFVLAVGIGLLFVVPDARSRGLRVWPFIPLTLCLGSIGLLSYLIYRERAARSVPEVAPTPSQQREDVPQAVAQHA
jgi:hypothetical protein